MPVITNTTGGLVNRQAGAQAVTHAAERAGIDPAGPSTHTGRRTAVTVLNAEAGLDLSDIARLLLSTDEDDVELLKMSPFTTMLDDSERDDVTRRSKLRRTGPR